MKFEVGDQRLDIESKYSAKVLDVYKKAYSLAMQIFEITKTFPKEERYSLTD